MIREGAFVKKNVAKWKLIDEQLNQQNSLSANEMAELYIGLTDDLAYARTFYPRSNIAIYLNQLVARTHRRIYKNKREKQSRLISFFTQEIPIAAYQSRKQILASLLIFLLAIGIGALSQAYNPNYARVILGDDYVDMTLQNIATGDPMGVYASSESSNMFFRIAQNNIHVALLTFILGLSFSVGTIFFLFTNGIMVGAFQTFFIQKGLAWTSFSALFIHGSLELSAIVIAGGAGLVLGNSILFPGTFTRGQALQEAGKRALKIFIGLVPVFIVAAFFEGFVTRLYESLADIVKVIIIVLSFTYVFYYFYFYPSQLDVAEIEEQIV